MPDLFDEPEQLLCISLHQPWASLMIAGFKPDETRHWATKVRGLVVIHAAKKIDVHGAPHELCEFAFGPGWAKTLPSGAALGLGRLTACFRTEDVRDHIADCDAQAGNFGDGRFAHRYGEIRPLIEPIPLKGLQGFFRWTPPGDFHSRLLPPADFTGQARAWAQRPRT